MAIDNLYGDVLTYTPYNHKEALDWNLIRSKLKSDECGYGFRYIVSVSPVLYSREATHMLVSDDYCREEWLRPVSIPNKLCESGIQICLALARKEMGVDWISEKTGKIIDVSLVSSVSTHFEGRLNFSLIYAFETGFLQQIERSDAPYSPVWVRVSNVTMATKSFQLNRIAEKVSKKSNLFTKGVHK